MEEPKYRAHDYPKEEVAQPSIKLIKNTKGYQWEIKKLGADVQTVKELKIIDDELRNTFVSKELK